MIYRGLINQTPTDIMVPVIFVVGPTAAGKTEVSFLLARCLKGEVISCDSMLVYKELRVITDSPDDKVLAQVPHHFVRIISVKETFNVFDFYKEAVKKIEELSGKNIPVIVCGGSGLYMKAILDGIFEGPGKNEQLRKELEARGKQSLYEELRKVDKETAEKISPNDLRRIVRALEVYYSAGIPISLKKQQTRGLYGKLPIRIFGLQLERELLYQRINARVDEMWEKGVVHEVAKLLRYDLSFTAQKIIGIKEIASFLRGDCVEQEAVELMKKNTRNFAKRQMTWFRNDKRIEWINADNLLAADIKKIILGKGGYV